jgi:hypothetical protein
MSATGTTSKANASGTAGTTIVTQKGSQGNLGCASLQALVQAQGIRERGSEGEGPLVLL